MSTETKNTKNTKNTKKTKALAAEIAGVQERVRGLATLPSERIEVARNASGKAANFRTHDDKQRRVMRGLHVEIGSISGPVVWIPDDVAREALRALPRGDVLAFAAWLAGFTGTVRLVDGHLRRELRDGHPMQVQVTDLDAAEAAKALATFDAVSDLAGTDAEALAALLGEIGQPVEQGTEELLQQLRAALPAPPEPTPNFAPGTEDEQGRLDQKAPITCPHCGKDFTR
jgi:hypothetical protein